MDKRTILFVISVSMAFFVVNHFFAKQNIERQEGWQKLQQERLAEQRADLLADVAKRTASAQELSVVQLNAEPPLWGVAKGNVVMTVVVDEVLPQVSIGKDRFSLVNKEVKSGEVALYAKGTLSPVQLGFLHNIGSYDLQLVVVGGETPQVAFAQLLDGEVTLPAVERLDFDAIALVKSGEEYLPVGVYRHGERVLQRLELMPKLSSYVAKAKMPVASADRDEEYFVLENDFQQLVFSSKGAALVEINLPFRSQENTNSVVRSIEFDKKILEQSPANARFPLHSYKTPGKSPQGPFVDHSEGSSGGYYPLLRRDLFAQGKEFVLPAKHYAFNVVSQYPEVAELIYQVKAFEKNRIIFEASQPHRRITKTYTISEGATGAPYIVELDIKVEGDSRGLWLTSGIPEVELFSGRPAPIVKYRLTRNGKAEVEKVSLPKDALTVSSFNPDWLCNSNGFLGMIVDPLTQVDAGYMVHNIPGVAALSRLVEIDHESSTFKASQFPGYNALLPLNGQGGEMKFRIFAGPFAEGVLKAVDTAFADPVTGYTPDYIGSMSFHGFFSFISEPFAKFLFVVMKFCYKVSGSWAMSIVLVTVFLRLMLYPLNAWSMKSMRRMQQIAPEVAAIQAKYKKDPRKGQMEVKQLYRSRGANPLSGCFPMLIQMPFLIGMFDLLRSTFELRGVPFIPGWIDNLTAPDVLFSWNASLPVIGNEFHLLPVLLGLIMFLQQKMMSSTPKDPKLMTDQQRQQKAMTTIMPVLFAVMFYNFASGLSIYWLSSMLLGIVQQWWTNRQIAKEMPPAVEVITPQGKKRR